MTRSIRALALAALAAACLIGPSSAAMVANGDSINYLQGGVNRTAETVLFVPSPTSSPLIAGSGNVANASAVATLTPSATQTAFIAGFEISGAGATAGLPVTVTVAGLRGGTRSYTYVFATGATVANLPLVVEFQPPLPASAINTAIVVTCPASGAGGTNNTVVAHGFAY